LIFEKNFLIYSFMKRLLDYIRFINENLKIEQDQNIEDLKVNLRLKFLNYKEQILDNIIQKPSEVEYKDESVFTFSQVLAELEGEFGKSVVNDLNLKTFLLKISQILDFARKNTAQIIEREFSDYLKNLDERIDTIKIGSFRGQESDHFDIEEGESSLIKSSIYNSEEEALQDELIKLQCWVKGGRRIKTSQANEAYRQKIKAWQEEQKALGKNTNPGEGTRKKFLKEVDGLDKTQIYQFEMVPGAKKQKLAIVFEGRDAAGKGSAIKRFTLFGIPGVSRIVAGLPIPTPEERANWFARYEKYMPQEGEIVFFDRSWYNRAVVEPVNGYCSEEEYMTFMEGVNNWEASLVDSGIHLIKLWFSITEEKQKERFALRQTNPLKFWKFSPNDAKVLTKYDLITQYKIQMFNKTSTRKAPWIIVNSNDKKIGRLNAIRYVLSKFRYPDKVEEVCQWYPEVVTILK
jgi:polyphosphate kinase 2